MSEPIPELSARDEKLPLLRDPDVSYYLRQEKDGLLLGPYDATIEPTDATDPMPEDFSSCIRMTSRLNTTSTTPASGFHCSVEPALPG